ncbi:PREDICTED: CKLF-like MARVEL transmembrane domain-containing protein 3 isoform X1 [Colobus angolensis palliatus]|uniref:CKLF-like MARVEL transmembrane domain-containing protein 3 isoform X1 n=1 Tax=Colobus angolensis palliatus TaxID=336983 RepID=UPI0005F49469|nr:PREDICTED: CKLF-like MARVEL transmembrane domain-containing protein 3 isoform X1 [Colobus angolensis palliatus]
MGAAAVIGRPPAARTRMREKGLSFITFICYVASSASAFLTAPLLEFLLALFFLFADAMQLNDKWQGLCWPMMDFLRCVTAALIYFAISITAVAKYSDGASKAAGGSVPVTPAVCPSRSEMGHKAGAALPEQGVSPVIRPIHPVHRCLASLLPSCLQLIST